jgi:hypothetical protein
MDSWQLAKWAGRARIEDNRHYDLRTPEERDDQVRAVVLLTERPTALEARKLNLPVSYQDLGLNRIGIADVTEFGMCTHDYAMSPCIKAGECMTCKEHVCIKGMPKTLKRILRLEKLVASQFEKAKFDAESGVFGADRWETHLGWKLAHIRTQRTRLESNETPEGAVLWIPPEHDPSPIRRALAQRNYKTSSDEMGVVDCSTVRVAGGEGCLRKLSLKVRCPLHWDNKWAGKLTWELQSPASVLGEKRISRHTLLSYQVLVEAFNDKNAPKVSSGIRYHEPDITLEFAKQQITTLEAKVARLEKQNNLLSEQFVRWQHNLYMMPRVDMEKLNAQIDKPLPAVKRR